MNEYCLAEPEKLKQTKKKEILSHREFWLCRAKSLISELKNWQVKPSRIVRCVADDMSWQHRKMEEVAPPIGELKEVSWRVGEQLILDFGETLVGTITLKMHTVDGYCDSPLQLRILASEMPFECEYRKKNYTGKLSPSWMQEEIINFDQLPGTFSLPRRYSCRYLVVELLAVPGELIFDEVIFNAVSAETNLPQALPGLSDDLKRIDQIGIRTLRNCMQTCFEDGPKRDRRLWLGDLRLQAMVNAVSYKRFDLVERSLYLLAGCASDKGMVPACVFERPVPRRGCEILDYALLFAPTLLDHIKYSENDEIAYELFDLAAMQFDFARPFFDVHGLFRETDKYWLFVDHCTELNRQTAMQGIYLYSLKALVNLALRLGKAHLTRVWKDEIKHLTQAARKYCFDAKSGLFISGEQKQISVASQVWMIISGTVTPAEGCELLKRLEHPSLEVVQPVTPYLFHHLMDACLVTGDRMRLKHLIKGYWGKMAELGADTFWEVFHPEDEFFSPYDDAMVNSACHAWSCTPSYYIRSGYVS